ncbi:Peroxidase-like protein [Leptotrombidium deliense]|uniref:Peroxidase-like protein n=1 Tax=Leptotrombidium deliense TaxID=299467 RepID=A0A443S8V5_9ACAR|nr:Peroxidase-like protein [Leptotrombidium deliense]
MYTWTLLLLIFGTLSTNCHRSQSQSQRNCPSFDGRSQLRPHNRDMLMYIEYKQWDYENRRIQNTAGQCEAQFSCSSQRKYRTADGSCNNLVNPRWGKSMECVNRLEDPVYADGSKAPKVAKSGRPLPNARLTSTTQHSHVNSFSHVTHMLMQWGQFLDHDITFTPTAQLREGVMDCCTQSSPECFQITIPTNDPFYSRFNRRCMTFVRSAPCLTCSMYREQINALTAFIDASNVYGSMDNETTALRLRDGTGMLRSQNNGLLLPQTADPENDQCSNRTNNMICFAAGDSRQINLHWDEETIFQEARRIVGAQMQVITYKEFLPLVLGGEFMNKYSLNLLSSGRTSYDSSINPTIYSEFSTAAFRFGHTLIDGLFFRIPFNGNPQSYTLRDNFFNPNPLYAADIDNIVRGIIGVSSQRFDPFVTDDVRNHLYKIREDQFGNDLVAFNIQRGRDHAIPGYTVYVFACHQIRITSFRDLERFMPSDQANRYANLYESVDDIDLFSAMISERPLPNAVVGPTMACIIGFQFRNLRFGDRYWFEHGGQSGSFTDGKTEFFTDNF